METVKMARFEFNRARFMAMDSAFAQKVRFTPSISLLVECRSLKEIEILFEARAESGLELMEPDDYGFTSGSDGNRTDTE